MAKAFFSRSPPVLLLLLTSLPFFCPAFTGREAPYSAHALTRTRAVRIKELNDANFEHDTQASTGQTTGRWVVVFVGEELTDKELVKAAAADAAGDAPDEGPAKPIRVERKQLASIDILHSLMVIASEQVPREFIPAVVHTTSNPGLTARFRVKNTPRVLLFRDQKVFTFPGVPSTRFELQHFIESGFSVFPGDEVPPPPSAFSHLQDQLLALIQKLKVHPGILVVGTVLALFVCIVAVLILARKPTSSGTRQGKQD